ncbi:MAG: F0F1 ATP synthase subunit A [Bacteroidetes bacterium]|nr:F0F1 ATP synthase subunit A [Bacteroidota bacterium]
MHRDSATSAEKVDSAASAQEFNAGEMIIEHIIDSHEWHICNWHGEPVSIPLPVILLDEGKLVVFSSGHFKHGEEAYQGYKLEEDGPNKGKIVKVKEDGTINEEAKVPLDFSITKAVLSLFIGVALILIIFLSAAKRYTANPNRAPKGIQSVVEPLILFVRDDIAIPAIGKAKYMKYMPYLLTIFFFIFINNLLGLIPFFPGGVNLTGNLAITMVMAIFTFLITTFSGNRSYWVHIVNTPGVPWWLKIPIPLMPIVEIIGLITKPFVLMVRLFANITAGHIILLGFMSLIFIFGGMAAWIGFAVSPVSILFGVFMSLLELLVAFIQAYVFALLSAIYFGMAVEEHHNEHAEGHEIQH